MRASKTVSTNTMGKRCTDIGNVDWRSRWLCAAIAGAWLVTGCGGGGGGADSPAAAAATNSSTVVKLTDHGANCNGTFDNAAPLASAIAVAKAAKLPLQLPSAVCAYGSVITLDGVKLQGTGSGSVLSALDGTQSAIFLSGDSAEVHDLTLAGVVAPSRQAAFESTRITALGARNFVIDGVTIAGASAAGIQVANAASAGRITNNHLADTLSDSIHISDEASDILIQGNVIERAGDDGISVVSYRADGGLSHDITARGNTVRDNLGGRAMSVVGGSNILYENNVLENSGAYACLYIAQESGFATYGVRNVVAQNNTMTNCGSLATGHGAIMVGDDGDDSNDGVSLIDNTIVQNGQAGIRVYGPLNLNVLLSGNRISGALPPLDLLSAGVTVLP